MYCAISGEVPLEPVVSKVSGHVFDRRLIEKALEASKGICPATGAELKASDLLAVKADLAVRPRPMTATSIPGMLAMFQNEWDEVMLETHSMKQQLHATRKELSHALYQHDAACRVVARLCKERDDARKDLGDLQDQLAERTAQVDAANAKLKLLREATMNNNLEDETAAAPTRRAETSVEKNQQEEKAQQPTNGKRPREELSEEEQQQEQQQLSEEVEGRLTSYWKRASKSRKKRSFPAALATKSDLQGLARATSVAISSEATAVLALKQFLVVSSARGDLSLADYATGKLLPATFPPREEEEAQTQRILSLSKFSGGDDSELLDSELFVACDAEAAVVWRFHQGPGVPASTTTSVSPPTSVSPLTRVSKVRTKLGRLAGAAAHPAGAEYVVVGAADGSWSFCSLTEALATATPPETNEATGPVQLHPDGLLLASPTTEKGTKHLVRMWDVKGRTIAHDFDVHEGPVDAVSFSENGYYMASSSQDGTVRVFDLRKLAQLQKIDLPGPASRVAFDFSGKYLAYAFGRTLKVDAVKEKETLATLEVDAQQQKEAISGIAFGPDSRYLAATTDAGSLVVFALPKNTTATVAPG